MKASLLSRQRDKAFTFAASARRGRRHLDRVSPSPSPRQHKEVVRGSDGGHGHGMHEHRHERHTSAAAVPQPVHQRRLHRARQSVSDASDAFLYSKTRFRILVPQQRALKHRVSSHTLANTFAENSRFQHRASVHDRAAGDVSLPWTERERRTVSRSHRSLFAQRSGGPPGRPSQQHLPHGSST